MNNIAKIYVGIDISKEHFDVHFFPIEKSFRVINSFQGVKNLIKFLAQYEVGQIVFEATGGYECHLMHELSQTSYQVWQVDPKRIKAFIISEGIKAKTDKIDARMIAQFAATKKPFYQSIKLTPTQNKLKALNKCRSDLLRMINIENNRVVHPQQVHCSGYIKKHIIFMQKQVKKIEGEINELTKTDLAMIKKIKNF